MPPPAGPLAQYAVRLGDIVTGEPKVVSYLRGLLRSALYVDADALQQDGRSVSSGLEQLLRQGYTVYTRDRRIRPVVARGTLLGREEERIARPGAPDPMAGAILTQSEVEAM